MCDLKNKSIALIIPDFDFGGEEKRVVYFANNYLEFFKEVYVISPRGLSDKFLHPDVKHLEVNIRNFFNIKKIIEILKKLNITYLQGHKRISMPYLLAAEKLTKTKSVFNFDNIYLKYNKLSSFFSPTNVVYLSDILKDFYAPYFTGHNNLTINMGGSFVDKLPEEQILIEKTKLGLSNEFVILSLGRLSPQKNHTLLLNALAKVNTKKFVCYLAGDGPLEKDLKQEAINLGISDKIVFLGHQTDIKTILNIADVLIQSSIFEGFPNVFIEAASVGLPIISTDVGSSRTLVKKNGILVPSNNMHELIKAIDLMIENHNKFKGSALSLMTSDELLLFKKEVMLANYIQFFKSI